MFLRLSLGWVIIKLAYIDLLEINMGLKHLFKEYARIRDYDILFHRMQFKIDN